jgi:hypothetical protein
MGRWIRELSPATVMSAVGVVRLAGRGRLCGGNDRLGGDREQQRPQQGFEEPHNPSQGRQPEDDRIAEGSERRARTTGASRAAGLGACVRACQRGRIGRRSGLHRRSRLVRHTGALLPRHHHTHRAAQRCSHDHVVRRSGDGRPRHHGDGRTRRRRSSLPREPQQRRVCQDRRGAARVVSAGRQTFLRRVQLRERPRLAEGSLRRRVPARGVVRPVFPGYAVRNCKCWED